MIMIRLDLFACCLPGYVFISVKVLRGKTSPSYGGNVRKSPGRPVSQKMGFGVA